MNRREYAPGEAWEIAKMICREQVGITFDSSTKTITMEPVSFWRCIYVALNNRPSQPEADKTAAE